MQRLTNAPLNWQITLSFFTSAMLFILLIGWLTMSGALPIKMTMGYSSSELNFIRFWVKIAAFISGLIPSIAFLILASMAEPTTNSHKHVS